RHPKIIRIWSLPFYRHETLPVDGCSCSTCAPSTPDVISCSATACRGFAPTRGLAFRDTSRRLTSSAPVFQTPAEELRDRLTWRREMRGEQCLQTALEIVLIVENVLQRIWIRERMVQKIAHAERFLHGHAQTAALQPLRSCKSGFAPDIPRR